VNSGNPKSSVVSYIAKNRVPWSVIVDTDREYEKLCGLTEEISLQNIHQVRYISGDGELKNGRWDDIEGTISTAISDATWRIDPKSIPAILKVAWTAVETGMYPAGALDIKKALKSRDEEIKSVAETLLNVVTADLNKRGRAAWSMGQEGKRWQAYQALEAIRRDFDGYDLPKKMLDAVDKLANLPEIKNEIRADKMLVSADKLMASDNFRKVNSAEKRLRSLIKKFPGTQCAKTAQERLDEIVALAQ
jgi:hypothetical protein